MKTTFAVLIIAICAVGAFAQDTRVSGSIYTNKPLVILPENARFQLVMLATYGNNVIRLDRFTGKTHIFEIMERKWYVIQVRGGLPAASTNGMPKYEIYGSEGDRSGFLINIETGQTWVLDINSRTWFQIPD